VGTRHLQLRGFLVKDLLALFLVQTLDIERGKDSDESNNFYAGCENVSGGFADLLMIQGRNFPAVDFKTAVGIVHSPVQNAA
jgi:hypothetical protein